MVVELMKVTKKKEITAVTSLDVAETFSKRHADVMRDIRNLNCSAEFRECNFAQSSYINEQNKKQPMYIMSRDGFTLLVMGYTGENAMKFKEAYIKQFNLMEKALREKQEERLIGKVTRHTLTDSIKDSNEDERLNGFAYPMYTNCVYKVLFGKTAKQMKECKSLKKSDNLRDYFTANELKAVEAMERTVTGLMDCGWRYEQIESFIKNNNVKQKYLIG